MLSDLSVNDIIEGDILELLGGDKIDPEQKKALYEKMLATVIERVSFGILAEGKLTQIQSAEIKKIVEEGDKEKFDLFCKDIGVDVGQLMVDEALKYKIELLAYAELVQKGSKTIADTKKQATNSKE